MPENDRKQWQHRVKVIQKNNSPDESPVVDATSTSQASYCFVSHFMCKVKVISESRGFNAGLYKIIW